MGSSLQILHPTWSDNIISSNASNPLKPAVLVRQPDTAALQSPLFILSCAHRFTPHLHGILPSQILPRLVCHPERSCLALSPRNLSPATSGCLASPFRNSRHSQTGTASFFVCVSLNRGCMVDSLSSIPTYVPLACAPERKKKKQPKELWGTRFHLQKVGRS